MLDGSNTAGLINDDREEGLFRVHRSVFVDREIFEQERRLVFDRSWLFAGHVSEFPKPGDFITRHVAGRPVILVHGDDGEVRALLNTCRHRGNLVCRDTRAAARTTSAASITAGFTARAASSRASRARKPTATPSTARRSASNRSPRMHNHRGCIFVSFDPEIESFESYMGDALAVFDNTLDLGDMEFVHGQFKYSMRANWKLLVENSMDGYHAAYTHERFFSHWHARRRV